VKIKRQVTRWQVNSRARIQLERDDFHDCTLSDISLKGCKLCLEAKLPRNRRFELLLILSDEHKIEVEAWVCWHKTIEEQEIYGLYFSRVRDSERDKLYKSVSNIFPEEVNRQRWEGGVTMEDASFSDRRIFERFSVKMPLKYLGIGAGHEGEAETIDVSAKGMGLIAKQALPLHTALELWLNIPDKGEPLYARGEVVWSRPAAEGGHRLGISLEKADLMGMSRVLRTI